MQRLILLLLISFFGVSAQEVKLKLTLYDAYGKPLPNTPVNFIEIETRELVTIKTDAMGTLNAHFAKGKIWQINILKISNNHLWQVVIPTINAISEQQRKITYDYDKWQRENRPPIDRSKIKFEQVKLAPNVMPDRTNGYIKISISKNNKTPLKNFPVTLTSYKLNKMYTALTNQMGVAFFLVPVNQEYQIDLGGMDNFTYVDLPNRPGVNVVKDITFEPCTAPETINGDTTIQQLTALPQPCTGRQAFILTVNESGKGPYANKEILIRQVQSGKIYKTKTTAEGIATLLLPFGCNYELIDKDDDVLSKKIPVADLTRAFGKSTGNNTITIEAKHAKRTKNVQVQLPEKDSALVKLFALQGLKVTDFRKIASFMYEGSLVVYNTPESSIGINKGLLLTTGSVENALGPNDSPGASYSRSWIQHNEPDLEKLSNAADGGAFFDPCIYEVDIVPSTNKILFEYLLGSEEYGEYLLFDDAFTVYFGEVGGLQQMVTKVDGVAQKISVSSINREKKATHFRTNETEGTALHNTWQYDGFTSRFVSEVKVEAGKKYTVKFIIADYHDSIYDSGAFVNMKCE